MTNLLAIADALPPEAKAAGAHTSVIERALGGVAAALQNLAKQLAAQAGKERPPGNPWQNIDRLRERWFRDFGADPLDGLDAQAVRTLRLALAGRHIIEHNGSVVDARYVEETGEGRLGQRLRMGPDFVREAAGAAAMLADRLESTAVGPASTE